MKTYLGTGVRAPHINLGIRWRWVVCFMPWPLYPTVPIGHDAVWAPVLLLLKLITHTHLFVPQISLNLFTSKNWKVTVTQPCNSTVETTLHPS